MIVCPAFSFRSMNNLFYSLNAFKYQEQPTSHRIKISKSLYFSAMSERSNARFMMMKKQTPRLTHSVLLPLDFSAICHH